MSIKATFTNATYRVANGPRPDQFTEVGTYHASKIEFYGSSGVWIPTLQFSSNLKSSADGIPFASLPIGLAWGAKLLVHRSNYIGGSVMANWLLFNQPVNSVPSPDATSFTVKALTVGVLFDVNNWASLGVVYGKDFESGVSDPGFMVVFGFGPRLIQSLKGKDNR